MKRLSKIGGGVGALAICLAVPAARGTLLPINSTVIPNASANALVGTTILGNTGVQNYNVAFGGASLVGTGQEWAVRNYAGNPFGASDITFVIQVTLASGTDSSGAPTVIERVTNSGYGSVFFTDAGYSATGTQVVPSSADRSFTGSVVGFNFISPGTNIAVGQSSALLIVNTNAPTFVNSTLTVQDGLTANLLGFAPGVLVPEPSIAIAIGIVGLAGFARRARRAS